jgi:hypothetical protein
MRDILLCGGGFFKPALTLPFGHDFFGEQAH